MTRMPIPMLHRPSRQPFGAARRAAQALALATALAALLPHSAPAAPRSGPRVDLFWQHPEFAKLGIQSVALLPVASFDHNPRTEGIVASGWGQRYQGAGYRWMTAGSSTALIRVAGGDSLLRAVDKELLDHGRADSLQAPLLCARLHVNALLSLRVDRWDQIAIEPDQRGKSSTTVALTAALVDSSGRLLWRGSGSETVEGIEHVPTTSGAGSRIGEAQLSAGSADTRPPAYEEALTRLLGRWGDQFPSRPAPPAPATSAADTSRSR